MHLSPTGKSIPPPIPPKSQHLRAQHVEPESSNAGNTAAAQANSTGIFKFGKNAKFGSGTVFSGRDTYESDTISEPLLDRVSKDNQSHSATYDFGGDPTFSQDTIFSARDTLKKPAEHRSIADAESSLHATTHATTAPEVISNVQDFGLDPKFQIALTFAGEIREAFIKPILEKLDPIFGKTNIFYDNRYTHALSQANLDKLLQEIYKKADLVLVVLSKEYPEKMWCNEVEYPVIQDRIKNGEGKHVMYLKADGSMNLPEGMTDKTGYIDLRQFMDVKGRLNPETIVTRIEERYKDFKLQQH